MDFFYHIKGRGFNSFWPKNKNRPEPGLIRGYFSPHFDPFQPVSLAHLLKRFLPLPLLILKNNVASRRKNQINGDD